MGKVVQGFDLCFDFSKKGKDLRDRKNDAFDAFA